MKPILILSFLILSACTTIDEPEQPGPGYIYQLDEYGEWHKIRPVTEKDLFISRDSVLI